MAANQTHQNSKSGTKRPAPAPARRPEPEEESSGYGLSEMAEQASDYITPMASDAREFVREHSGATVVAALVTGFGIGLMVGHTLGIPGRSSRKGSWKDRVAAEGLGRRLLDRFDSMIPDALAEHFGK